jgi:hypothetical protein
VLSTAGTKATPATRDDPCEQCGGPTIVQKTVERRVVTIEHGAFYARETVRLCAGKCRHPSGKLAIRRSAELADKVPTGANYGYDLEVHVGLARFVHHRQREEIRAGLHAEHGIALSNGEVSDLTARFLDHLERLHQLRAPQLRQALEQDGGYAMHIDATGEDGRGTLFATYAGSRRWVLGSWKISTERSELILPCLQETVALFGAPMAVMRDLGKAVTLAARALVDELGSPIPVLACHFHFLRDVGKDLLAESHDRLRDLFRRFGTRPALRTLARDLGRRLRGQLPDLRAQITIWIESQSVLALPDGPLGLAIVRAFAQWALDYSSQARDGYPFSLPYLAFYQRCHQLGRAVDGYLRCPPDDAQTRSALARLARVLSPVVTEIPFVPVARRLAAREALFGRLRAALRLRTDSGPPLPVLPPDQAAKELRDIREAIDALTKSLRAERPQRGPAQNTREAIDLILDHLDRHGDSLWGHEICLPPNIGGGVRMVDRTNQILEGFWHQIKHGERRRSGRKILTHDFETLPAAAVLAANLRHDDYVTILCGGQEQLPSAFADLDLSCPKSSRARSLETAAPPAAISATEPEDFATASLPKDDRRFIRKSDLAERIRTAAHSRAPRRSPRDSTN